jgi:Spy/CpxP family protein refolding chaperone
MKTKFAVLLAAFALTVSASGYAAEGADHHHAGQDSAGMQKLELNAGKKWATDAPLRQAMSDINRAMARAVPLIHKDQFDDAAYQALAATVRQKVAYTVEHCKLEPKADAMLHLVIADLMAGAETMEGKTAHPRHDGAVAVLRALNAYGRYFQHPGWHVPRD